MKKTLSKVLATLLCVTMAATIAGCTSKPASTSAGADPSTATPEAFKAAANIDWTVTSGAGGGSDIYTRMISDIMTKEGLCDQTFLISNKTDGGGEVGRLTVSQIKKGKQADHALLTFNSGDLMPMIDNTQNRVENFTPIAVMAIDKQLLFKGEKAKYADINAAIDAAKAGTQVVIGGSKGDDIATYEAFIKEIGVTEDQMAYITYNSTGDAITAILGGHVDLVISKPAAASQYVEAGSMVPVLALSTERYTGNLADAPTLSEVGDYADVEVPVWRGVVGPKDMSPEAAAYWTAAFKAVSESDTWKKDYIEKNKLISNFMGGAEAATFMSDFQVDYIASKETAK